MVGTFPQTATATAGTIYCNTSSATITYCSSCSPSRAEKRTGERKPEQNKGNFRKQFGGVGKRLDRRFQ